MARGIGTLASVPPVAERVAPLRVATLDSDSGFLMVLGNRLERLGWTHEVLAEAVSPKKLAAKKIDALVVDLACLGPKRWDWLARLGEEPRSFGIIVCTGSSTVAERVRALQLGADGWLSKPCHPEELIARVESLVGYTRRPEHRSVEPVMVGEVEIRHDQFQAFVAGSSLGLTRKEFKLIDLFVKARGEVLDREVIYQQLWGYEMARNDRSVDVFVHKLRRKLKDASPGWRYIHTQLRVGYRFAAEPRGDRETASTLDERPLVKDTLAA